MSVSISAPHPLLERLADDHSKRVFVCLNDIGKQLKAMLSASRTKHS
jgi:hypothetical protein